MNACRSISYAPDRPVPASPSRPEWTICRNCSEFPVPDHATLERWTEQGRVRPDDYLVNQPLDLCVQAREVAALDAIFRRARAQTLGRICRALACSALASMLVEPVFAGLIFIGVIGAAGFRLWTLRHRRNYQLSTIGTGPDDSRPGARARLTVRAA